MTRFLCVLSISPLPVFSTSKFNLNKGAERQGRKQEDWLRGRAVPPVLLPVRRRGIQHLPNFKGELLP